MARLTAPLLSLAASGTIAKSITFSSWKGIAYARTRVIPYNPKSVAQQEVRGVFSTLNEMWKRMPQLARDPWQNWVTGKPLTGRNKHIQASAAALKGETDLAKLVMSVAGGQAVPPEGESFTPGTLLITAAADTPVAPVGYTLTSMIAACCLDGDPSPVLAVATVAIEDVETPFSCVLEGLTAALYQVGIWCKWTRDSDSKVFYSTAVRGTATPTAE